MLGDLPPSSRLTRFRLLSADAFKQRATGASAAGEADLVDIHVAAESFTSGMAVASDHVEYAFRQAGFHAQFGQFERGERRHFGRLQDDRAAAGQRRRYLPDGDLQRIIPGDDRADHSDRLAQRVVQIGTIDRDRLAVDFANPAGVVAEGVDGGADIGARGFAQRLAVLDRFEPGKLVLVFDEQLGDVPENFFLLRRIHPAPALLFETRAGGRDGAIDIGAPRHRGPW